eukprot:CAMPEP_0119083724 /NCGR_PEP_ID=MMETSP1178-20130426/126742_1 /TAXON_ID=33656 /ORGANISM="unid sp, Strain CCMP2000" /LENGTH=98 /DNA_ID=CAMNT_0007066613 /DNA_START=72 /DNA_END=368 /DNA_ORIENTATION=-
MTKYTEAPTTTDGRHSNPVPRAARSARTSASICTTASSALRNPHMQALQVAQDTLAEHAAPSTTVRLVQCPSTPPRAAAIVLTPNQTGLLGSQMLRTW